MNNIRLLDSNTINKIAAGEVIERPASVIKELIENSIDAMSSFITVEIEDGGKKYIRVTDNGTGISADDVELAFLRHSTSKIKNVDDLHSLSTLGFRGEALASIASVSQLELITRTKETISGIHVFINGGEIIKKSEVGCPVGTTIILRNLFYNVPVRQKFLKSDTIEASYISDIIYRLALGNPGLKFKYIKDNKVIINTPGKHDLKSTIYSLLGKEFVNSMFDIDYSGDDIEICGLISSPAFTRGNRNHQYTYVNGRYIKSEEISEIIESLYKTLIPINRFPVYAIYINISPELIDVNVHPTKTEIRFDNIEKLKNALSLAIGSAFSSNNLIPEVTIPAKKDDTKETQETFLDIDSIQREKVDNTNLLDTNDISSSKSTFCLENQVWNRALFKKEDKEDDDKSFIDVDDMIRVLDYSISESPEMSYENKIEAKINPIPDLNIIGNLFDTYIMAEDRVGKELYIIDQHAAHERIMYEKIKTQLESDEVYKQQLLTPLVINISHGEMQLIKENIDLFDRIGFDIDDFGLNSIVIRSVPLVFGVPDTRNLFLDILDNLKDRISSSYEMRLDKIMKLACSSAIKAGHNIKKIEIDTLLNDLRNADQPYTCPHGRPIIIKISKYELEKRFKRV
ncbi:DNA mismatch repair endonuclease MutL [Proteiniborus sp. MB09-C3]|uniref:DNA mismatch repair endonuclease MutL n=1 Tax=Proteiniborus sp. MB09-C3 TaxID=3050072 RepID=UPI0025522911|nr:DNA mismatch repair endonuclease MutL [Proteiniborus sp. MB09-C3]WIV10938.1 DNA mismatch repair endonuclease MutL [Proteiniborus sp. MB09-C3]